jgi:probable HAF family extracellular repeat protein
MAGISASGGAVVGYSQGTPASGYFLSAIRWTPGGGTQALTPLAGYEQAMAFNVSGDGQVVIGRAFHGSGSTLTMTAFRWTSATGMQALAAPAFAPNGLLPRVANSSGSVVVGMYNNHTHPSTYDNDGVFAWTAGAGGGMAGGRYEALPILPGVTNARAGVGGVNGAGTIVVGGQETVSAGHFSPVMWSRTTLSGAWSVRTLGVSPLHEGHFGANVVNADGSVVGGTAYMGSNTYRAILWTPDQLTMDLNVILPQVGFDLTGWQLTAVTAISDDGTQISGLGHGPNGDAAWTLTGLNVAALPAPSASCLAACAVVVVARRRR